MSGPSGIGKDHSGTTGRKRGMNIFLGVIAALILLGSLGALVYNALNTRGSTVLEVNGKEYEWETLYDDFEIMTVDGHEGVSVKNVIIDSGISEPEGKSFRFKGSDGYQKEVPWDDVRTGLLNKDDKKVIFPDLAKAFWVRDLVEIEVV
jgi:hypothetical protein